MSTLTLSHDELLNLITNVESVLYNSIECQSGLAIILIENQLINHC